MEGIDIEIHCVTGPSVMAARPGPTTTALAIIDSGLRKGWAMADLLVRGLEEDVVRALKARAAAHGRSAEAEHRDILQRVLTRPRRRSLAEVLASMPDVGTDADFERVQSNAEPPHVLD
jgi:plasmid stability protein